MADIPSGQHRSFCSFYAQAGPFPSAPKVGFSAGRPGQPALTHPAAPRDIRREPAGSRPVPHTPFSAFPHPVIVGDIGGTNARFAVIDGPGAGPRMLARVRTADYPGVAE